MNQDKYLEFIHKKYSKTPVDTTKPYGWLQYKGIDICCDIHCECGDILHIDGYFVYAVECPICHTVYLLDNHITLFKLNKEQIDYCKSDWIQPKMAGE